MANSRYDFHKEEEKLTDLRFNRGSYIIIRIDGHKFHNFSAEHNFHKPNDKRALDLMIESAKQVMRAYKGQIPLAYGHSDEFSFLIRSCSSMLSRRIFKITSMLPVIFATSYNSNWDRFFNDPSQGEVTKRKYDAWFDARPKEYPNYKAVIDYYRWRQIDCHINNLYNTTLHALTGRYVKHELTQLDADCSNGALKSQGLTAFENGSGDGKLYSVKKTPITDWITEDSKFMPPREATERLSETVSSDKHDIMFLDFKINYNNELEQFKKGAIVVDTQRDYNGKNADLDAIKVFHRDLTRNTDFWDEHSHIFDDDYVACPPTR